MVMFPLGSSEPVKKLARYASKLPVAARAWGLAEAGGAVGARLGGGEEGGKAERVAGVRRQEVDRRAGEPRSCEQLPGARRVVRRAGDSGRRIPRARRRDRCAARLVAPAEHDLVQRLA